MVREGDVELKGWSNSGCRFSHNDSVIISTNLEIAKHDIASTTIVDETLSHITMSKRPWPESIVDDNVELLPKHIEKELELSAITMDRPIDKVMTLDLTAPVIMLNSMFSEAASLKRQADKPVTDQGIVYGESLVELLRWILDTLKSHTHPPNSPPKIPMQTFISNGDLDTRHAFMDKIGHQYNILNYYVRSK
jgi:hypothetical protein